MRMYVTPRQKRRYFWVSIILIIGMPLTTLAAIWAVRYFSLAGGSETPQNIVISNLSSNSASISWSTETQASGSITVNGGKGDSAPFIDIRGTDRRYTHYVDIVDLDPSKDYTFTILSNDNRFTDGNGNPFKFKTAPITSETPIPKPVYGAIAGSNGDDALVFVVINNLAKVYPASSATTASGKWILDLSGLRDPASRDLISVDNNTKISFVVKGSETLGGSVTGTYGELVDTDGQLKSTIQINDVPTDSLFTLLPKDSVIASASPPPITPPTPPEEPETPETPQEPEIPEEPGAIVSDVEWVNIKGTETSQSVTSVTGENSVEITNITDTGFNVVWVSSTPQVGSVKYGTSETSLTETALDERDSAVSSSKYTSHSVKLTRLQPETKYFFEIYTDTTVIKNNGVPFDQTTFKTLSNPPEFKTISGKISGVTNPADTVVMLSISQNDSTGSEGISTLTSTIPDSSGNWVVTLGDIRDSIGADYFTFTDEDKVDASVSSLTVVTPSSLSVKTSIESGVILVSDSASQREIVSIPALDNYFVYSVLREVGSGGSQYETNRNSSYTPKTAISLPLLVTIVVGILTMISGFLLYFNSQRKFVQKIKEKTMTSSVF